MRKLLTTMVLVALFGMCFCGLSTAASYDIATDFSVVNNPNGTWSYGWSASRGADFNLITQAGRDETPYGTNVGWLPPNFAAAWLTPAYAETDYAPSWGFIPKGTVNIHPGPSGQNSVIRWTAPLAGTVRIDGWFTGNCNWPTSTDVAILHDNAEIFTGLINSYQVPLNFSFARQVAAGDTIDFTVGYGTNRDYYGDNTGVHAILQLSGSAAVADAGSDQSVRPLSEVTLDGSGSSDPGGNYPLSYAWAITAKPAGSMAAIGNPTAVNPSFVADVPGEYVIQLVVTNSKGEASSPDQVLVSTYNTLPVADAGFDQAIITVGTSVQLRSQSYDPDGDAITHQWTIISKPEGSAAALSNATSATPSFVADVNGSYEVSLVVRDPWAPSASDSVIVSFNNIRPVANAGGNQSITIGDVASLDGTGSADGNLDPLTFAWSVAAKPEGSSAALGASYAAQTTLSPELPGTYVVSLVVSDGIVDSEPSNVTITVMSKQERTVEVLQGTMLAVNGISPARFKNPNMAKALTNKINAALADIELGDYAGAFAKLKNDVLEKTDGCARSGAPDKNDWIESCAGQGEVYPLVSEAIELLETIK